LGDYEEAIEHHKKALKIDNKIGDKAGESSCYGNLGIAYCGLGDIRGSIRHYLNAEKIIIEMGETHNLKIIYDDLSVAYRLIGDHKTASKYKKLSSSM
jgi:tetratricopeptide (TPR) repeat protein